MLTNGKLYCAMAFILAYIVKMFSLSDHCVHFTFKIVFGVDHSTSLNIVGCWEVLFHLLNLYFDCWQYADGPLPVSSEGLFVLEVKSLLSDSSALCGSKPPSSPHGRCAAAGGPCSPKVVFFPASGKCWLQPLFPLPEWGYWGSCYMDSRAHAQVSPSFSDYRGLPVATVHSTTSGGFLIHWQRLHWNLVSEA